MDNDNFGTSKTPDAIVNIAKTMKEAQDTIKNHFSKIDMQEMMKNIPTIETNHLMMGTGYLNRINDEVAKAKEAELKREIENNENLKSLTAYNHQLVNYNEQLVKLNENILSKINTISNTMDGVLMSIGRSSQIAEGHSREQTALLIELVDIMESKDDSKKKRLGEFLKQMTGEIAVGLMIEYLKIKMGKS